jgi:hypothetical protein
LSPPGWWRRIYVSANWVEALGEIMKMRRSWLLVATVVSLVALPPEGNAQVSCPSVVDPGAFADAATLRAGNQVMADLGVRQTASPAHERFVGWVERGLRSIPGIELSALPDRIHRQTETGFSLELQTPGGPQPLAVAGAVPYAAPAPDGVAAPVVYVPAGTAIAGVDVENKVVVRDALPGSIPMAAFGAVAYYVHDPDVSFDYAGNYERDWVGAAQRITDLQEAQDAGAAGLVFVHELPTEQVRGQYAPYPGIHWQMPALYLGVDEGTALKDAVAAGPVTARLSLTATHAVAPTRTLIGRLQGQSDERIVIESHTDGMNAIWDNGPISILALARYFAALPLECRPRTFEFVFTTAHLYLTHAGAHRYAEILDEDYDDGTVALVVALEHLGAREWAPQPRTDGPGRRLESTGLSDLFATFTMESPVLVRAMVDQVVAHDLRRTFVLRGADAPQVGFPPHRSFGGEGGPYRERIVPTVAAITGPWTLFDPAFGMEQIDVGLMRRQTLAFGDVVLAVDDLPRQVIAGADTVYRAGRDLTTASGTGR